MEDHSFGRAVGDARPESVNQRPGHVDRAGPLVALAVVATVTPQAVSERVKAAERTSRAENQSAARSRPILDT